MSIKYLLLYITETTCPCNGTMAGMTSCTDSSTIPKVPPPPPRRAQNRSEFWHAFAVRTWPSGVTIWNWSYRNIDNLRMRLRLWSRNQLTTRSTPRPYAGERTLWPPPYVCVRMSQSWSDGKQETHHDPSARSANGLVIPADNRDALCFRKRICTVPNNACLNNSGSARWVSLVESDLEYLLRQTWLDNECRHYILQVWRLYCSSSTRSTA